jgi:hypothetical protein
MRATARGLAVVVLGCLAAPARGEDPPRELRRIQILMLMDTGGDLGASVRVDTKRLLTLWERTIPQTRYTCKVIEGKSATRAGVLDALRALTVRDDEGVVFFYAGHGATVKKTKEHFFIMSNKDRLWRKEILSALQAKKPGLAVLLTDCCSTPVRVKFDDTQQMPGKGDTIYPTVRHLFFQSRGTVDITAATDAPSWCDPSNGGLFTRAVCKLLFKPVKELDTTKDKFVDWEEFFAALKEETQMRFLDWKEGILGRLDPDSVPQSLLDPNARQVPAFFGKLPSRREAGFYLACFKNALDEPIRVQVRWSGEKDWRPAVKLEPDQRAMLPMEVKAGARRARPRLEIRILGRQLSEAVEAEWWEGAGKPSWENTKGVPVHPFPKQK